MKRLRSGLFSVLLLAASYAGAGFGHTKISLLTSVILPTGAGFGHTKISLPSIRLFIMSSEKNNTALATAATQDTSRTALTANCALYYPDCNVVIGGRRMGFPRNLQTWFLVRNSGFTKPYVAFIMSLPREDNNGSVYFTVNNGAISKSLSIMVKFMAGSFSVTEHRKLSESEVLQLQGHAGGSEEMALVRLVVNDVRGRTIIGAGTPFRGYNGTIHGYVNAAGKVQGHKSLREIVHQHEFCFIFRGSSLLSDAKDEFARRLRPHAPEAKHYDYGSQYNWDLNRYKLVIPANRGGVIPPLYRFDDTHHAVTTMTQAVVQDVFSIIVDCEAIREIPQKARVVVSPTPSGDSEESYVVLVLEKNFNIAYRETLARVAATGQPLNLFFSSTEQSHASDEGNEFWEGVVMPEFIRGFKHSGSMVDTVYLGFNDGASVAKARVNAINNAFFGLSTAPRSDGDNDLVMPEPAHSEAEYNTKLRRENMRSFLLGWGYAEIFMSQTEQYTNPSLDSETRRAIVATSSLEAQNLHVLRAVDPAYRVAALSQLPGGIVRVNFEEYIRRTCLGLVTIFGPEDSGKTQTLAVATMLYLGNPDFNKIHASASSHVRVTKFAVVLDAVAGRVHDQLACPNKFNRRPVIVRGYAAHCEIEAFVAIVDDEDDPHHVNKFRIASWGPDLSIATWLAEILNVRSRSLDDCYTTRFESLRRKVEDSPRYEGLRKWIHREIPFHAISEHEDLDGDKLLQELMAAVVAEADVVCTMPHRATEGFFKEFNLAAKAVVLDDAGFMNKYDALVVWGDEMRPCIMAGDDERHPYTVTTQYSSKTPNRFLSDARISIIEHCMRMGNVCFVLGE
ncbi:transcription factor SPT20 [Purpureocillium lavendulum]|uniref:Transcription factor SPT20 n=1 Tax=Purpureocillium lavendulum TaxID=1247861 RepID=A0AB34FJD4_9HYPO|nr:transcription factor SPT20 [Purpureocillium lavendulum]